MKYLKRFQESIDETDRDDVLNILQYVGDTKAQIWQNDFVRLSNGILVVYFEGAEQVNSEEVKDCNQRLESLGYQLVSYDYFEEKLWFLVISLELLSKYRNQLHFRFIEDLKFKKRAFNMPLEEGIDYCNIEYSSGDTISVMKPKLGDWFVTDSITETEETADNKVVANIYFLESQHRVQGILGSLSRGF